METTRRNFLKIVASVGAASVVPLRLLAEDAPIASGDRLIASLRELVHYDPISHTTMLRHDVLCADAAGQITQLGCDQRFDGELKEIDDLRHRGPAIAGLRAYLDKNGLSVDDVYPIPKYKVGDIIRIRRPH